ncbi:cache domain-containing sensor histidine kinase [Vallitalea maricola]|uniref:Sensor histidine kinase n=1 Tax=Vallitalea maricola TaxID=3074433 RepID=A0ACB5UG68_9FIRM|nr:sensor histidine kinase [Vallitalea sp. AN17-2]
MKYKHTKVVHRVIGFILAILVPILFIVTILFFQTKASMQQRSLKALDFSAREVQDKIDETVHNIYSVSDSFAKDQRLIKELDQSYGPEKVIEKRVAVLKIANQIFNGYNRLNNNEQIAAIYTVRKNGDTELFNIVDANYDGSEQIKRLENMGITNKERLTHFFWYPLQENFLKETPYDDLRKDNVIFGTRRIYSALRAGYPYIHIFALREESLYLKYADIAAQEDGKIYIITNSGVLLSSSDLNVIASKEIRPEILKSILDRSGNQFSMTVDSVRYSMSIAESDVNDWMTVLMVPIENAVDDVNKLYFRITWIIIISILGCGVMILYFFKRFTYPIAELSESMMEVNHGNLNAYVQVKADSEIGNMIDSYNDMLRSINHNIKEKLLMEKKKKELEMEVLMNQINPHFLYNTLETIVWKSNEAGRQDIGRIAASLGRMYRLSISDGEALVKISREIEHLMAYINIQKSRYDDLFECELLMDAEAIRDLYSLKLILQPVAENAFLYALDEQEHTMKLRIKVVVRSDEVRFVITDNGIGMDKEKLVAVREQIRYGKRDLQQKNHQPRKSTGIGLHNISDRLRLYFGVENGVRIYSKKGLGTVCIITIPKMTFKDIEILEDND